MQDGRIKSSLFAYISLEMRQIMKILRVSKNSEPSKLAGAIAGFMKERERIEIETIGAGSLNQAIKAVAIARGFLAPIGIEICIIPSFQTVNLEGKQKTAIRLKIETN